eukprot:COSAG02_NODE_40897_length_400_cov_0.857143_1_plen_115_part_10
MTVSFVGSPDYVSPELLADEPQCASAASDLWALGCILFHILAGESPFLVQANNEHARNYETMNRIKERDFTFPVAGVEGAQRSFPAAAKELVDALLCINPQERLGAQAVGPAAAV